MTSRTAFLICLLIALLLPPFVEHAWPAVTLPPAPKVERLSCGPRTCTLQWRLDGSGRLGAALLAPRAGLLLDDTTAASGVQITVIERHSWQPGQQLEVLEWGEGWERRTRWSPTVVYFPRVAR
jgi:hypothetical protein